MRYALGFFGICLLAGGIQAEENYPPLKEKFEPAKTMNDLPLVYSDDFSAGQTKNWEPTDKTAWTIKTQGGNKVYALTKKKSQFNPPVRSPYNRSLVKDVEVESFVLDLRLQSTHPDYGHRDLCLFFGYQDDSHLYYVHFGKKTDDHANQIFIVNDAARKKISTKTTPGTDWDDEWHHARIVRDAVSGKIDVYFDDMKTPVMSAVDRTFTTGRVGVGSFDDTGQFDHIAIYGNKVEKKKVGKATPEKGKPVPAKIQVGKFELVLPPGKTNVEVRILENFVKLAQVEGKVLMDGIPLSKAEVTFIPEKGKPSLGVTDESGEFVLTYNGKKEGCLVGKHQVQISKTLKQGEKPTKELIPPRFNAKSQIQLEVQSGVNMFEIELKSR